MDGISGRPHRVDVGSLQLLETHVSHNDVRFVSGAFLYPLHPRAIESQDLSVLQQPILEANWMGGKTFPYCACGEKAADFAFNAMQRFVASSDDPRHRPDLGPLVGTTRSFKTRERVPGCGRLGGVETDDEEVEDKLNVPHPRFRPPRPPDPPPLKETMPPKNHMRRRWKRNAEFVPTRNVLVRSEPLRVGVEAESAAATDTTTEKVSCDVVCPSVARVARRLVI
ncbi:hypothetical protein H0H92_014502 [Tricholoma furcatifolium]|nr:hypothetical protein H0H92_014502 [Tricholoma furcatifolium]